MAITSEQMLQVDLMCRSVHERASVSYYTFNDDKYRMHKGWAITDIKELRDYLNTLDLEEI
jgi:hypothetical protein